VADDARVAQPTLYQRIGGIVGVEAVVHALHRRVEADPDLAAQLDPTPRADLVDRDILWLACVLDGGDRPCHSRAVAVLPAPWWWGGQRHLRDALWMLGVSSALVDEVAGAVFSAT
jgi:hypothetical protein